MIIDAHSHFMPPAVAQNTMFFKEGWSDVEKQLAVMDENKIDKALLLYPTSDAHLNMGGWTKVCEVYNESLARVIKKFPGRFIGAGILPIDEPKRFKTELNRMRELGLQVISMASSYEGKFIDDEMFYPVYDFAREYKMPIHVHPQIMNPIGNDRVEDPLLTPVLEYVFDVSMCIGKMMMSGVFMKYDDVNFIFAHFGGVLPLVKDRFDTTYEMLRKRNFVKDIFMKPSEFFKKLYFDTSGSRSVSSLLLALEVVPASNLLFGSDFPANYKVGNALDVINKAPITDEQKGFIKESNLLKFL